MTKPGRLEIDVEQLNALLDRIEQHKLTESDFPLIADLIRSMAWLSQSLEDQNITIHRLRKIFGFKTSAPAISLTYNPRTNLLKQRQTPTTMNEEDAGKGDTKENSNDIADGCTNENSEDSGGKSIGDKLTRKGRKFSAKDYKDAVVTKISHTLLNPGCRCPDCQSGNLRMVDPGGPAISRSALVASIRL